MQIKTIATWRFASRKNNEKTSVGQWNTSLCAVVFPFMRDRLAGENKSSDTVRRSLNKRDYEHSPWTCLLKFCLRNWTYQNKHLHKNSHPRWPNSSVFFAHRPISLFSCKWNLLIVSKKITISPKCDFVNCETSFQLVLGFEWGCFEAKMRHFWTNFGDWLIFGSVTNAQELFGWKRRRRAERLGSAFVLRKMASLQVFTYTHDVHICKSTRWPRWLVHQTHKSIEIFLVRVFSRLFYKRQIGRAVSSCEINKQWDIKKRDSHRLAENEAKKRETRSSWALSSAMR